MSWRGLLRKAVLAEGSQATVAARLGYSPAAISQVLNDNYNGQPDAIRAAVLATYGGKKDMERIPDGYKRNAVGHLVPIEAIKEEELARDQFVQDMVSRAQEFSTKLQAYKKVVTDDFQAFMDLSAENWNVILGGEKGNVGLKSFDGRFEVVREVNEILDFDERLHIAKAIVDECLVKWSAGLDTKIKTLIMGAFQVDSKGKVNTKRILGLRRYKFDDERWQQAMRAIDEAIVITGSCTYFRFYAADEQGKLQQVKLDFSGI